MRSFVHTEQMVIITTKKFNYFLNPDGILALPVQNYEKQYVTWTDPNHHNLPTACCSDKQQQNYTNLS